MDALLIGVVVYLPLVIVAWTTRETEEPPDDGEDLHPLERVTGALLLVFLALAELAIIEATQREMETRDWWLTPEGQAEKAQIYQEGNRRRAEEDRVDEANRRWLKGLLGWE